MRPMNIRKTSPAPGLMKQIRPRKLTLTGRPANKEEFLLTKSQETTMDFAELVEKYELEGEDELQKSLADSDISEDAVEGLIKAARVVSAFADEITGDDLEKTFHALGYEFEDNTDDAVTKSDDGDDDAGTEPDVAKSELAKRVDNLEDENSELRKKLEDREEDEALQKWVSKANELSHVSGDAETIGQRLRTIEKADGTEAAEDHLDSLRGYDEAVEKSEMFSETGVSGSGGTTDAEEELEKRINELRKNDEDMSRYEAKKAALREMDEETANELRGIE